MDSLGSVNLVRLSFFACLMKLISMGIHCRKGHLGVAPTPLSDGAVPGGSKRIFPFGNSYVGAVVELSLSAFSVTF